MPEVSSRTLDAAQTEAVARLIDKYDALPGRTRRVYQETEVRTNFIDPLFAALGWQMDDRSEVERETSVDEGKRPDYIFKVDGVPRFFLEAKPFRDDIYDETETRKAITKAYNRGVSWVGVTNFARFVLYDAQEELTESRPRPVFNLACSEYLEPSVPVSLDLLTPAALRERALETYAERAGARRHAAPIEKSLYQSMRDWREKLFNALYQVKQWKTDDGFREGDEAIQRFIDRLIFLRNCEDRRIGGSELRSLRNQLRDRTRHISATERLIRIFAKANDIYDSELFRADAIIDLMLPAMGTLIDETITEIINGLYAVPRSYSEYDFSQMEPDVLGEVYEQYLGFVPQRLRQLASQTSLPGLPQQQITLTAKRQRRREQGIFYTPRWVVQYIVDQTVRRFLDENRDRPDIINDIAILDPACGSGSFLIRAYETLLDHHGQLAGGDASHLDRTIREGILRRNIFGVDLDPQAVEIARLNLLIRMVCQQELLPPLKDNIQHGNSLIDGDAQSLRPFFGQAWDAKTPFDWGACFPQVMERGGFDIIIGNPPYVRIQNLPRSEAEYYRATYRAATGSYDIYCLFVERALSLLRPGGVLGFIVPNKFMHSEYGKGLRSVLTEAKAVSKIVDFGDAQIFESGTNYTCILLLQNKSNSKTVYVPATEAVKASPTAQAIHLAEGSAHTADLSAISTPTWVFVSNDEDAVMNKLREAGPTLKDHCEKIFVGLQTSADDVYVLDRLGNPELGRLPVRSRRTDERYLLETDILKPLLSGQHVSAYGPVATNQVLLFPYSVNQRTASLISPDRMADDFPLAWAYLQDNKERLENREAGRMRNERWYAYVYPKNLALHEEPKLCIPRLVQNLYAGIDQFGDFYLDNVDVNGILNPQDPFFLLAVLNSHAADWYFQRITVPFHSGFRSANRQFIEPIPIPTIETEPARQKRAQVVALVQRMLDLRNRLADKSGGSDYEAERLQREIATTQREIDALVYDLYGLTDAERAIVDAEVHR